MKTDVELYSAASVCAWHIPVLDCHKQRGGDRLMTAPVAELQQLVKDAAADDVQLLRQIIAELETEKALIQNEVKSLLTLLFST